MEDKRLILEPRGVVLERLKDRYRNVSGSMSGELMRERREEATSEDATSEEEMRDEATRDEAARDEPP